MNNPTRQRLRLRYRKDDVLMYISHRDLLRFVMRLLRRAEIPFATSGKFSPKPKVTFGPALPLGVLADNELLDVELQDGVLWEMNDVKRTVSMIREATSPRDFIAGLSIVKHGTPPLGKSIVSAEYEVAYAPGTGMKPIQDLLENGDLGITDKKDRQVDLREAIREWSVDGNRLLVTGNLAGVVLNITILSGLISSTTGAAAGSTRRLGFLDNMGRRL